MTLSARYLRAGPQLFQSAPASAGQDCRTRALPPAPWLDNGPPPVPDRRGNEVYFMVPYPSHSVQKDVRTERPVAGWFDGVQRYPVARRWTDAPSATWPAELQNFSRSLYDPDRHRALIACLREFYSGDEDLMRFVDWLEWYQRKGLQLRKVSKYQL